MSNHTSEQLAESEVPDLLERCAGCQCRYWLCQLTEYPAAGLLCCECEADWRDQPGTPIFQQFETGAMVVPANYPQTSAPRTVVTHPAGRASLTPSQFRKLDAIFTRL